MGASFTSLRVFFYFIINLRSINFCWFVILQYFSGLPLPIFFSIIISSKLNLHLPSAQHSFFPHSSKPFWFWIIFKAVCSPSFFFSELGEVECWSVCGLIVQISQFCINSCPVSHNTIKFLSLHYDCSTHNFTTVLCQQICSFLLHSN